MSAFQEDDPGQVQEAKVLRQTVDWLPVFAQVGHGAVMYLLEQTLSWFNYELQTGSPSLLK